MNKTIGSICVITRTDYVVRAYKKKTVMKSKVIFD